MASVLRKIISVILTTGRISPRLWLYWVLYYMNDGIIKLKLKLLALQRITCILSNHHVVYGSLDVPAKSWHTVVKCFNFLWPLFKPKALIYIVLWLNKGFSFYGFLCKSWICGITTCMHVSFFVQECDYFLLCQGRGYSLWWPITAGRLRPEVQPPTRRESVLHLWLIPILWQCGFPAIKKDTKF